MVIPVAAIMMMVGKGIQAYGEYTQVKMTAANMEYEAYIAGQDAQNLEKAGEFEQRKARTIRRKLLARQVALAAASGRDISGGSPLAIIEASERAFILDEQIIAYNKYRAVGAKRAEAVMAYGMSRAVKAAGKLGLYASLLGMTGKAVRIFGPTGGDNGRRQRSGTVNAFADFQMIKPGISTGEAAGGSPGSMTA